MAFAPHIATKRETGEIMPVQWDGSFDDGYDVIIMQRWMSAEGPDVIKRAQSCGQIILQEIDDLFLEIPRENQAFRDTDPRVNKDSNRRYYNRSIKLSDGVIVSTPYLKKRYENLNERVIVCRNALDIDRWLNPTIHHERVTDKTIFGWMGSTTHRGGDIEIFKRWLGRYLTSNPDVAMAHIGHAAKKLAWAEQAGLCVPQTRREVQLGLPVELLVPPDQMYKSPPVAVYNVQDAISQFDVGVAPLTKVPFNRAKSGLKIMEFAAMGIPAIATNIDEYKWFGASILVDNIASEWQSAFDEMRDPLRRKELGEQAFRRLLEIGTIDTEWVNWRDAINQLTS